MKIKKVDMFKTLVVATSIVTISILSSYPAYGQTSFVTAKGSVQSVEFDVYAPERAAYATTVTISLDEGKGKGAVNHLRVICLGKLKEICERLPVRSLVILTAHLETKIQILSTDPERSQYLPIAVVVDKLARKLAK